MAGRFIPDSDCDFVNLARAFARNVTKDPQRYTFSDVDVEMLTRTVTAFDAAYTKAVSPATRSRPTILAKDERRKEAEAVIRRLGAIIRASNRISAEDKLAVGVKERSKKLTRGKCPIYPPRLWFEGVIGEGGLNTAVHQLRVEPGYNAHGLQDREGATRIELFVDLVGPGDPIPSHPGEFAGGRPWYLGSFTKSPIRISPPVPPVPMLVVYWARWADSSCRVGPFSNTCQSRWEGIRLSTPKPTLGAMPELRQLENDPRQITLITQFRERYIEGVRVDQRMLEDSRGELKQLAGSDAPSPRPLPEGEGSDSRDAA